MPDFWCARCKRQWTTPQGEEPFCPHCGGPPSGQVREGQGEERLEEKEGA